MGSTDANEWVHCGRRFNAEEIRQVRETVAWLPGLARGELAATVCEHLDWHTASGTPKIQACQRLLERLAAAGLVALPALRQQHSHPGQRASVVLSEQTATDRPLAGPLRALEPVHLEVVTDASQVGLWNEYVERFHPLGYKGAFGYRLRYFIRSGSQRLGCVLLAGAARAIAVRDRWIGWSEWARLRNLPAGHQQQPISDLSPRSGSALGKPCAGATGSARGEGLAKPLGIRSGVDGDLCGPQPVCRHLLSGGRMAGAR